MRAALYLASLLLSLYPATLWAQVKEPKDAVVIFKDGFHVKGKSVQKKDRFVDPYSGNSIVIPAGGEYLYLDDGVRRINFSITRDIDVLEVEPETLKDQVAFIRGQPPRHGGNAVLPGWHFEDIGPWDAKWERTIKVKTDRGRLNMKQRLVGITPRFIAGYAVGYDWAFAYQTREFEDKVLKKLILDYLVEKGKLKTFERQMVLARFFAQAGMYKNAMDELADLGEKFPEKKDNLKDLYEKILQQQADQWAETIAKLHRAGQHENVQAELMGLERNPENYKVLADKHRLAIQDLKTKYETWTTELAQAKDFLKEFPMHTVERTAWTAACKAITEELNIDTLGRLKTFLEIAPQHAKQLKAGQGPTQKTDEVLALAVSGWLQGDNAAATDAKAALQLWRTRKFLLEYLRADDLQARRDSLASFKRANDIPIDVIIRIIRLLPPVQPYTEKLSDSRATKMTIEAPGTNGGNYFLQLPPEYNPLRSYPVLLVLQSHRWGADEMLQHWQQEAARAGFILAAPLWGGKALAPKYDFTQREHAIVLDTLRDLRWRFNVDSDRVFLFGWEQGATAAFDIGLAHPDQFAGILPMNGDVKGFPQRYATNAQYLPFYIVEGDRNGILPASTRIVFKEWIRSHYPSLYIEYKGRSSEWYEGEIPTMLDWMSRKHRLHPLKELGRYHTSGGAGEEFKTMRLGDNRFYWLTTDDIMENHLNDYHNWSQTRKPATLQASCAVVNEDAKAGPRIWTQFNIRTTGLKQLTLWIAPNQLDFSRPVRIRHNGANVGGDRHLQPSLATLLEELYTSGDRQRLFVVRLDFRL